jgi:predicted  nucleic acid-binding Zn-ribbon protein
MENKLIEKKKEIKTNLQEKKTEFENEKEDMEGSDSGEARELRKIREASDSSREHMNQVADDVNELLQMKEDARGIGKKVKEVAEQQIKSQEKIAEKLAKMEEKKIWLKKMLGYDKEAVLSVKEEIGANRLRIQELQKLQEETTDKTEINSLENAANSLIEQNASLQDTIQTEMQNQGVWGWFRGFFNKNQN